MQDENQSPSPASEPDSLSAAADEQKPQDSAKPDAQENSESDNSSESGPVKTKSAKNVPGARPASPQPDSLRDSKLAGSASADGGRARWYVVHTYSGHESKVAATLKQRIESQQLQDKVLDILVPTQEKIEIKEGKKNKIKEKIFPGYLLIRMVLDDNTWLIVRTTPGITSFVGMGNKPTALPDEEVATIQRYMTMEAPNFKTTFSVGEAVKITDGPFSEFLGSISEIDDSRGKIKVLVSIFGRETPVELDFLQVAKL